MNILRPRLCSPLLRAATRRTYAVQQPGAPTLQVFDRKVKHLQRERAASHTHESRNVDYLRDEVAARLCERLLDINRKFDNVLDLGANACNIAKVLTRPPTDASYDVSNTPETRPLVDKIGKLTAVESSEALLYRDAELDFNKHIDITRRVIEDEEHLPFEENTFDACLSSLSMHWINDLPSVLRQINHILKPDAPLMAVMFGGDSLFELRTTMQLADLDRRGGVSTHVSPLADTRDVGGLLQSAGFKLLTVDVDDIVVDYPDCYALMADLQAMGENNAALLRDKNGLQRDVLMAMDGIYRELHGNEDGTIPATFRLIYLIGWKEHPSQQKPEARGSGQINLQDALGGGGGWTPSGLPSK